MTRPEEGEQGSLDVTVAYHERTKHLPFRYAASLGYMDWATQPNPFRRFDGAPLLPLDLFEAGPEPLFDEALEGRVQPAPLDRAAISRLFHDSLALSAWKEAGGARWALRVNPSSGNLHPTEGYLIAGPVRGLHHAPAVFHYAPHEHALELRAELPDTAWRLLAERLPDGAVLVGLASIHWREAWKYGERAFRYCQHDVGHAIAAVAVAAAGIGWQTTLVENVTDADICRLLGIDTQAGPEAEHPDCLIAVVPRGTGESQPDLARLSLPVEFVEAASHASWSGTPNRLSPAHHEWPAIADVAAATEKHRPPGDEFWVAATRPHATRAVHGSSPAAGLRAIVHQRRSAVAFDGRTGLDRDAFYRILGSVMPGGREVPLGTLPWRPCIDLLLFVHRVADLRPGVYVLLRETGRREALEGAMTRQFRWERPEGCPASLPLFLLEGGDARRAAAQTSCEQDIASDGAFAVAMVAEYRAALAASGAWFYRRLFWETGAIGQILYLEAELHGIRATGIGCFFDDLTHKMFALDDERFQVLYHFTMGGPVEDRRLQTHPPYQHLEGRR